ncbi:hypothetical protein [Bythopirellula polymerisocia]|nr:hypothetical protein [Bythopirellula polymerisocia]
MRTFGLMVTVLLMTGCGNNLSQVTGVVSVDGQPLQGGSGVHATVFFHPVSKTGAAAVGVVGENGIYKLSTGSQSGITPGEYVVTCSASQIIPSETPGGTPSGKRISDPKYASAKTSGLRCEVQQGDNVFDISMDSAPKSASRQRR